MNTWKSPILDAACEAGKLAARNKDFKSLPYISGSQAFGAWIDGYVSEANSLDDEGLTGFWGEYVLGRITRKLKLEFDFNKYPANGPAFSGWLAQKERE